MTTGFERPIRHDHVGSMVWLPDRSRARECRCEGCGQVWRLEITTKPGGTTGRWRPVTDVTDTWSDPWGDTGDVF